MAKLNVSIFVAGRFWPKWSLQLTAANSPGERTIFICVLVPGKSIGTLFAGSVLVKLVSP